MGRGMGWGFPPVIDRRYREEAFRPCREPQRLKPVKEES